VLVSCLRNGMYFVAIKMGRHGGSVWADRRIGVWAFAMCHQICRNLRVIIAVEMQSDFQRAETPTLRYVSPRRPIFIATLRAGASWLFFCVALSTRMIKMWVFVTASPARTALKNAK
jgi:hypothetical protein